MVLFLPREADPTAVGILEHAATTVAAVAAVLVMVASVLASVRADGTRRPRVLRAGRHVPLAEVHAVEAAPAAVVLRQLA